jgi:SPW repeat
MTTERFFAYWQDSLNFLLGVVLLFSPWLFGFGAEQAAALNAHVVGAIIAVMALLALIRVQDLGGVGKRRVGRVARDLAVGTGL